MKLLFDQNLSVKLPNLVENHFQESHHVADFNLSKAGDEEVWQFAKSNHFSIVTKDSDFNDLSLLFGSPPKIIWIRRGNCSTLEILNLLVSNKKELLQFNEDSEIDVLTIY